MRPSLNSVRLTKRCPNTFTKKSISPWAVPVQMVIWCRLEIWLVSTIALQDLRSRSEEHTSELQSLMRISYAVFCLKKKNKHEERRIQKNTTELRKTTKQNKHIHY